MTEILAPGGSFASAIAALDHGADAVYCGLPRFSARKGAKNLNLEQLYRLREYCARKDKKIYLALNTLIREEEWPEIRRTLQELEPLHPQGIILQDLGLLRLLRQEFPAFPLHGSTQMALHNPTGARQAQKLGLERIVLSRECGLEQILRIRKECPVLELEVFVHGALCVSFSGLCFASGRLLDRSSNRGECGQVCRTWFDRKGDQSYPFSARDLELGRHIEKLRDGGIHSLKIEGRMKGPEYAAWTAAYYRAILDDAPEKEIDRLRQLSRQAFARESTHGWFHSSRGHSLIQSDEPGHRGIALGILQKNNRITLESELSQRDGLLYLPPRKEGSIRNAKRFSARFQNGEGQPLYHAAPGDRIKLLEKLPPDGELFRISRHDQSFPEIKENRYPVFRPPLEMTLKWSGGKLFLKSDLGFSQIDQCWEQEWQESRKKDFRDQWNKLFLQASGGPVEVKKIHWGETDWDSLFLPPSRMKEIRREFRQAMDSLLFERDPVQKDPCWNRDQGTAFQWSALLDHREKLNPKNDKLPFLQHPKTADWKDFHQQEGKVFIPLKPVLMEEESYLENLMDRISRDQNHSFVLGLNNLSHLSICDRFREENRVSFWVDYGLYCSNGSAAHFFQKKIPRLEGILYWIEGSKEEATFLGLSFASDFRPPLFNSAVCFRRHSLGKDCSGDCGKHFEYSLDQRGRKYRVLVRDCWSYLTEESF